MEHYHTASAFTAPTARESRLICQTGGPDRAPGQTPEGAERSAKPDVKAALRELLDKMLGGDTVREVLKEHLTGEMAPQVERNRAKLKVVVGGLADLLKNYEEMRQGADFDLYASASPLEQNLITELEPYSSFDSLKRLAVEIGVIPPGQPAGGENREDSESASNKIARQVHGRLFRHLPLSAIGWTLMSAGNKATVVFFDKESREDLGKAEYDEKTGTVLNSETTPLGRARDIATANPNAGEAPRESAPGDPLSASLDNFDRLTLAEQRAVCDRVVGDLYTDDFAVHLPLIRSRHATLRPARTADGYDVRVLVRDDAGVLREVGDMTYRRNERGVLAVAGGGVDTRAIGKLTAADRAGEPGTTVNRIRGSVALDKDMKEVFAHWPYVDAKTTASKKEERLRFTYSEPDQPDGQRYIAALRLLASRAGVDLDEKKLTDENYRKRYSTREVEGEDGELYVHVIEYGDHERPSGRAVLIARLSADRSRIESVETPAGRPLLLGTAQPGETLFAFNNVTSKYRAVMLDAKRNGIKVTQKPNGDVVLVARNSNQWPIEKSTGGRQYIPSEHEQLVFQTLLKLRNDYMLQKVWFPDSAK